MLMLGRKPVSPLCMPYAGFEKATNCVFEIPQNIKLEIRGSNVIVKAGSIGVRPGSTYQTYTFTSDYSFDYSSTPDGTYVFMVRVFSGGPGNIGLSINFTVSGATDSLAGTTYHTWFDTTNLQIKRYGSDPNNPDTASMYPFAIINVENGVPSFAKDSNGNDMIFNGAGFIGHHAFVYPGVKVLIADGFNADGSLKSIEYTLNSLNIEEMATVYPNIFIRNFGSSNTLNVRGYHIVNTYDEINIQSFHHYYVKSENKMYRAMSSTTLSEYGSVNIVNVEFNGTTFTDFAIQQPLTKYRWVVKLIP